MTEELSPRQRAEHLTSHAMSIVSSDGQSAVRFLLSATVLDPTYAEAWYNLGVIEGEVGALEASCFLYRKALACDPEHIRALVNLSFRSHWCGRTEEAEAAALRAIEVDFLDYHAWVNLSVIQSVQGRLQESLDSAKRANGIRDNHETKLCLAFAYLYLGDFATGLKYHESRFENQVQNLERLPWPRWAGEDVSEKTVLIISEQGIGDTLSFMRFVPLVAKRARKVELTVHENLLRLVSAAMLVYPNVTVRTITQVYPEADFWTSFMSLPFPLQLSNEEIRGAEDIFWPPFTCPVDYIRKEATLNVGICWAGNPDCAIEKFRRIPLLEFEPLASVPGVQLYSLQIGESYNDIHNSGFSTFISDLKPMIHDVADTFGILKKLDLVITAETSIGHMCGALGIPCWVLCSRVGGDFRIGRNPPSSAVGWYPNHRYFQQTNVAGWTGVMESVREALTAAVSDAALRRSSKESS